MAEWVSIVVVIAVAIAAMLMKERLRVSGLEKWARGRGFTLRTPFTPDEGSPAWGLAGRFTARGAKRWGAALEGSVEGVGVTLAEFETTWAGARQTRVWQTLAVWPMAATPGPIVVWSGSRGLSAIRSNTRVGDRLGLADTDPDTLVTTTASGAIVEGEPAVRNGWLTGERARALEGWAHGGEFARDGTHAAWRMEGALSVGQVEKMVEHLPAARRLLA